ncbi:unnamed protein product [Adineta steineri]|uniref:Uncharacterized protein n=1 Tax=Adineta steineri TaxID=433720 RepID=A0A814DQP3_9BILA|nr:unnamed protein product [Adineta steineri]CAF0956623.1 unnamed protein product [Adineta steineri]CAF0961663.1 unnamed protein product [Adineta steineri]
MILKDSDNYSKDHIEMPSLFNKNRSDEISSSKSIYTTWQLIMFIFMLLILVSLFGLCLCYQRFLLNYVFDLCSKTKSNNNNNNIDQHTIIYQRTPSSNSVSSTFLTVPQFTQHHYYNQ